MRAPRNHQPGTTMGIAERLGVRPEQIDRVELLRRPTLPDPEKLIEAAFQTGPNDPEAANMLLASAVLSYAERATEGRLAAALALLARMIAKADPARTLGPDGAAIRAEAMPNGWRFTLQSFPRLRYAWRSRPGLRELLEIPDGEDAEEMQTLTTKYGAVATERRTYELEPVAQAMDEVTRLNPAEPEPVTVAIQEQFPPPRVATAISLVGIAATIWSVKQAMGR
jgi:hypothetical protein